MTTVAFQTACESLKTYEMLSVEHRIEVQTVIYLPSLEENHICYIIRAVATILDMVWLD